MASVDRLSVITMNLNVKQPLTSQFLLVFGDQEKCCPSFYGKEDDKKKVKEILQQEIHSEVRSKWGHLQCHCQKMPKIRLSKTTVSHLWGCCNHWIPLQVFSMDPYTFVSIAF